MFFLKRFWEKIIKLHILSWSDTTTPCTDLQVAAVLFLSADDAPCAGCWWLLLCSLQSADDALCAGCWLRPLCWLHSADYALFIGYWWWLLCSLQSADDHAVCAGCWWRLFCFFQSADDAQCEQAAGGGCSVPFNQLIMLRVYRLLLAAVLFLPISWWCSLCAGCWWRLLCSF